MQDQSEKTVNDNASSELAATSRIWGESQGAIAPHCPALVPSRGLCPNTTNKIEVVCAHLEYTKFS